MGLVYSLESAQTAGRNGELWKGDYLVSRKMPWSKMSPMRSVWYLQVKVRLAWSISTRYVPGYCMLGISSASVLIKSLGSKSLLCLLCVTSLEGDEVVVRILEVPRAFVMLRWFRS